MINRFQNYLNNPALGLLALRLAIGIPFLYYGLTKLMNMGPTVAFFASLGLPAVLAWLVVIIETVGGLLVILGFATQIIASLFIVILIGAITLVKGKIGYGNGGYEFDLVLLLTAIGLICLGAGRYTIRKLIS